jgi:type IV secretory pathway protease TraF
VAIHPAPRLIWNATASMPVGLYRLQSVSTLHVGDLIAIRPPADIATMLAHGGYLPLGVPLLKPVAALPGQLVCRIGAVSGRRQGARRGARLRSSRSSAADVQGCQRPCPARSSS